MPSLPNTIQHLLPWYAWEMREKCHKSEGKKAFPRHGFFSHQLSSTCPIRPWSRRRVWPGKEAATLSVALSPSQNLMLPTLSGEKEGKWEGGHRVGSGGIRAKCTMSSQLGWHSEQLTCGNWAFAFKVSSPGNIFFDGCTSVKKHDDPDDRWRDEEGCI